MDYSIEEVNINEQPTLQGVNRLLAETFGVDLNETKLQRSTRTNSLVESLYLAATKDDEIIGFNAFISHDLDLDGTAINCYQICWVATSNAHRGKKIFHNLINTAKEILALRGAAFMFGFPNENSQAIFTNKLGFREIGSLKWQVPNVSGLRGLHLRKPKKLNAPSGCIKQNDNQLIELKTKEYGKELIVVEYKQSLIWGVIRARKKIGIELRYFEIGGVQIDDPEDIKPLFDRLWGKVKSAHYFQLTTTSDNSYNQFFTRLKNAQTNDLIVFDLNLLTSKNHRFNFFGGVKDVF
jgi:predicted N-acetyltransferase YhbS